MRLDPFVVLRFPSVHFRAILRIMKQKLSKILLETFYQKPVLFLETTLLALYPQNEKFYLLSSDVKCFVTTVAVYI